MATTDPRMTHDNTYYQVDVHIHRQTQDVAVSRDNVSAYVADTSCIHIIDGVAYVTMRVALQLGLITEFEYQKYVTR